MLKGSARENIGAYFRGSAALRYELAALDSRRHWRRATAAYVLGDMASDSAVPALLDHEQRHSTGDPTERVS